MPRKPGGLEITAVGGFLDEGSNDGAMDIDMQASMEFTDNGSLQYKGFKINDKGVQASPDGAYPRSGLTVPDLAMGEIIGRGSSSVVRQAEVAPSPSTGGRSMTVAVKIMETVHNPELRKQLLSELHLLLPRLREKHCPYIARIFEVMYEKLDDRLYIVLEYCHGGSLDAVLRNAGPVLLGLRYLFEQGIQHRDIKPANLLMTEGGVVKISDFGSSKDDPLSSTFVGTTRYMSPERLNGEEYGWAADLWAAGITFLEAAMGEHPYRVAFGDDSSFVAMIEYASQRETPQLSQAFSDHARSLVNLCLAKNPRDRPSPLALLRRSDSGDDEDLGCAHPFVALHAHVGPSAVAEWAFRNGGGHAGPRRRGGFADSPDARSLR